MCGHPCSRWCGLDLTLFISLQVDIFSFGMFMYELIALHFPFEKQNLMTGQIEKLIVEGSRPQLQHRVCALGKGAGEEDGCGS